MAKTPIAGKDVGFYVEKTAGSGTYTRVGCVASVTLTVTTEMNETDCVDSAAWKEQLPGQNSFDGSGDLTVRQLTDVPAGNGGTPPAQTDATDGVSAENLLDYQIAGRKILMRVTLGTGTGTARYGGNIYLTKFDLKAGTKGNATASIAFTGTGPLDKTLAP